jgi:hypothetical protein
MKAREITALFLFFYFFTEELKKSFIKRAGSFGFPFLFGDQAFKIPCRIHQVWILASELRIGTTCYNEP